MDSSPNNSGQDGASENPSESPPMTRQEVAAFQRALYSSIKATLGKGHDETTELLTQPQQRGKVSSVIRMSVSEMRQIKVSTLQYH